MLLTPPDAGYAESFRRYVAELRQAGDANRVAKYAAGEGDFSAYVETLRLASRGIGLPEGRLPYFTFWLVDGGEIVGMTRVRPHLTPKAEQTDGHIGYDVAPSRRKKGYGTAMLRLALREAGRLGLSRVIVTCATTNVGSQRVIQKCGGVFLGEVADEEDGHNVYRYEFTVPDPRNEATASTTSSQNAGITSTGR
jgi:predicted acetyltransferase